MTDKKTNSGASLGAPPASNKGGSSLGGGAALGAPPKAGASLGTPPAANKGGSSLGGGAALGAPPKAGASLGGGAALGKPPAGSSLGGGAALGKPPAAGAALGGGAALGKPAGSGLGGPPVATLGQPASAPATIGKPPAAGASLGGGAALGKPPAAAGSGLGGPPSGSGLGGPPATSSPPADESGSPAGGAPLSKAAAKRAKAKEKKAAKAAAPAAKTSGASAAVKKKNKIAEMILKQQEEERKRIEEEERLQREEDERIKREEERREQERIKKKAQKAEERAKQQVIQAEQKRKQALARLGITGNVPAPGQKPSKPITKQNKAPKPAPVVVEEKPAEPEPLDSWEDLLDDEPETKSAPVEVVKQINPAEVIGEKEMRSPICCVLGHVDTGKTLLLDRIRRSNVQRGEAGGITQQIGATYLPIDPIKKLTASLTEMHNVEFLVPGLLVIDTPGHESFTNLRSRGSSLCDISVLVVDINHGIEQQTEESLKLLRQRKTPFVVALNKIDRIYEWEVHEGAAIHETLGKQKESVRSTFQQMAKNTITEFAERGLNAALYYDNKDVRNVVSLVPTSARTGEGIPDLLVLVIQLTQRMMAQQLYLSPTLKCTVLEVKLVEGLGMSIDVIVSDGILREGQKIVLCGINGAIVTNIRALLTPQPLKEIRINAGKGNPYDHQKFVKAAMGVKVVANDLKEVVAGSQLFAVEDDSYLDDLKEEVQADLKNMQRAVSKSGRGVYVQASTLGSLEALLSFLKDSKIPVSAVGIGPIHKRDVTRASVMLEHDKKYAVILAFDVKTEKAAQQMADKLGVQIFSADIIYHLEDMFTAYLARLEEERRKLLAGEAVWPAVMEILPEHVFNNKNPIVFGVKILEGSLRIGTPLCAVKPDGKILFLGKVSSIEENRIEKDVVGQGTSAAIKIVPTEDVYCYGRHFDHVDTPLMSRITRNSLDRLKEFFGKELTKYDIRLLKKMKEIYEID